MSRRMLAHRNRRRGNAFLSMIMAVMIIMILTVQYNAPMGGKGVGPTYGQSMVDRTRTVVTGVNLRTALTQLQMYEMEHGRMTPAKLREFLQTLPPPVDGGRYFQPPGGDLLVTTMVQSPTFSERMKLPEFDGGVQQ